MLMSIPPKIVEARSEDNCHNLVQLLFFHLQALAVMYNALFSVLLQIYNSTEVLITWPSYPVTSIATSRLFILIIPTPYQDRDFLTFIINNNCIRLQIGICNRIRWGVRRCFRGSNIKYSLVSYTGQIVVCQGTFFQGSPFMRTN